MFFPCVIYNYSSSSFNQRMISTKLPRSPEWQLVYSMIRYLICPKQDIYIYTYTFAWHVVIYNCNSDVIDICTDVSILNIFTRHFHLKNIFQIFPLCVIESSTWYLWIIDLFRQHVSHTYRDIMYPDLNDYLFTYLFIYFILRHLCKHKQCGHLLVMGFFFFFFFF
jgi:hypothetical protein